MFLDELTMDKNRYRIFTTIGLLRWEIVFGIITVIFCLCIYYILYPISVVQITKCIEIAQQLTFLKNADTLPQKLILLERADSVESARILTKPQKVFNEPAVLKNVYTIADSVKCKIDKIQIVEPIYIGMGTEIPVLVNGRGMYHSIGAFVDAIEKEEYAVRISQLNLKNTGNGEGDFFLDFVIMENRERDAL